MATLKGNYPTKTKTIANNLILIKMKKEQIKTKEMEAVKIICRMKKNKNLYFCNYTPSLDEAINNFKSAKTVKVIKGVCYISFVSLGYFTEILSRNKVNYSVITTLN